MTGPRKGRGRFAGWRSARTGVVTVLAVGAAGGASQRPAPVPAPPAPGAVRGELPALRHLSGADRTRVRNLVRLAEVQIYGDIILETVLIYLTGGPVQRLSVSLLGVDPHGQHRRGPARELRRGHRGGVPARSHAGRSVLPMAAPRGRAMPSRATSAWRAASRSSSSAPTSVRSFIMALHRHVPLQPLYARRAGQAHRSEASLAALRALHEDIVQSVASGLLTFDRRGTRHLGEPDRRDALRAARGRAARSELGDAVPRRAAVCERRGKAWRAAAPGGRASRPSSPGRTGPASRSG